MKKTVSLLLSVLMVLSLFPMAAVSVNAEETAPPEEVEFTEVYTVEDLYMINYALDGNYKLMNDIDLSEDTAQGGDWDFGGRGWEPIGSNGVYSGSIPFTGTFDGNGYEIKGLRINVNSLPSGTGNAHVGLFAKNAGTIKNLVVSGSVSAGLQTLYVGAIAGYNSGVIENCVNAASVSATYSKYVGGITGYTANESEITRCKNTSSVHCSYGSYRDSVYSGGIAGYSLGAISECYNSGKITSNGNGYYNTYTTNSSGITYGGSITNCYNTGTISATSAYNNVMYVGGISADSSATIKTCYNTGTANKAISYGTVTNCYFLSGSGADTTGAKALTANQMKQLDAFNGFDFENIWFIDLDAEYNYPQLRNNKQIADSTPSEGYQPTIVDGVVEIRTIQDLNYVNKDLAGSYKLMNDIDLSEATAQGGDWDFGGRGWEPIGSNGVYSGSTSFTGTFDGNGYEIKGLRINVNSLPSGTGNAYVGLFAKNAGTIKNLVVSGSVSAGSQTLYVGAIAGYNSGVIENCANAASVSATYSKYVGGITGYTANESEITRCKNTSSVHCSYGSYRDSVYSGGIAGYSLGAISECYNSGKITSNGNGYYNTYTTNSSGITYGGSITNCYNTGTISATSAYNNVMYVGGISADSSATIKTCYNTGTADKAISYGTVTNCYFLSGSGADTTGAKSLTAAQMKLKALYGGFDFDNVWFIDRNLEYQYPQLIHNRQIPKAETPTAVEITAKPEKLSYFTGEAFDSTGLVVSVVYENGDKEEVTRYTLSGYDSSTAGTKTITVTYGDLTATFDVEVEEKPPVLTSIAIIKQPDKMNYYVGDAFDGTGLAVYAVYDNGSSKEITDYTLSGYDSSTTGKKTITVSYEGFTAAFDVEVQEKPVKLTSISVVKKPDKLSYFVGEAFDDTGMVVVALYDNNTTEAVTDYTLSGFDSSTTGKKTITVAYKGLTATFDVEVKEKPVSLTSITIVHKPDKLSYFIGEEFDSTGLIVNAVYDNGTSKAVTDYTLSGFDNSTVGKKTITVAYKGLKATFDVEVKEKPVNLTSIMIVHKPNKLNYFTGEEFDSKGMIVNAVYDNGTSKAITDYTLSGFDSSTAGKKTITVSYEDFTAAFDVEVQEKPVNLTSVAIVKKPDKLSYFVGEAFDDTGMVVVALYDNNTTEAVNDYNFSGFDSSTTGKKTITVAYKGLTATFDVEIKEKPVNLTSITIVQKPDKLSYFIDEEFDSTGLIVNAVYDNGTSKAVTDYTLSGFDSSTVGKKTITVTYGDYTAGFEVEVKAQPVYLKSLTVIKQPDKTVYNIGEELDTKGMMVIGVYSDGAVVNISDYTVSKLTEDIGEQTVTVSYEGKTATFNVTVEDKKVLIGDVNNDGQVNGADAGVLSRYAAGWKGYADKIKNLKAADVNNDGSVNGADAGILARYTSGWKQYAKFFES